MIITCDRCYEWAEQVSIGGSMISITYSPCVNQHCRFLREHSELGAKIDPIGFKRPYLEAAIAAQNSPRVTTSVRT